MNLHFAWDSGEKKLAPVYTRNWKVEAEKGSTPVATPY